MNKNNITIDDFIFSNLKKFEFIELELLVCFSLKKPRSFLVSNNNYILKKNELTNLKYLLKKRNEGYSIASIIGKKEFYGRDFKVTKNTLIPRPETEKIIDEVLIILKNNYKILDIGTGTGCIPITLFLESKNIGIKICGLDICNKALEVAKYNSKKYGTNIKFKKSDILSNIKEKYFDIIIANLPYVPIKDKNYTIEKEPKIALYSGKDGLDHYKKLAKELKEKEILFKYIFLEIAPFQSKEMKKIFGIFGKIEIIKDFAGKNRIVKIINNKETKC